MKTYRIRYIHKISPNACDVVNAQIPDNAFSHSRTLAKALRDNGVLTSGTRFRSMRVEGEETLIFPDRGIWHCLVITLEQVPELVKEGSK